MPDDSTPGAGARGSTPVLTWGAVTHVGAVREHNEDSFHVSRDVCIVADGMGGHQAGEVASRLVVEHVAELFDAGPVDIAALPRMVSDLNAAVRRRGVENDTPGMGTTAVGLAVTSRSGSPTAVVFHVGDSRCYRLWRGRLAQLTTDHSHVQEMVAAGRLRPEDAATHPLRNVITRALGVDTDVQADYQVLAADDCRILLCSDGLSGEIGDDRIRDLLLANGDPTRAAVALVDAVLGGPARDNVTAIVIDVVFADADATEELESSADDVADEVAASTADAVTRQVPVMTVTWAPPVRWEPPHPVELGVDPIDRPPSPADEAAWGQPLSPPNHLHQETDHAPEEDH